MMVNIIPPLSPTLAFSERERAELWLDEDGDVEPPVGVFAVAEVCTLGVGQLELVTDRTGPMYPTVHLVNNS